MMLESPTGQVEVRYRRDSTGWLCLETRAFTVCEVDHQWFPVLQAEQKITIMDAMLAARGV